MQAYLITSRDARVTFATTWESVKIDAYAKKMAASADLFEAWSGEDLIGLVSVYCNAVDREVAFVTNVSVVSNWQGQGIASRLLSDCINYARDLGFSRIELDVDKMNAQAIALYRSHGFSIVDQERAVHRMRLTLAARPNM